MLFLTWNFLYVQGNHTFYEREKIDLELLGGLIWFCITNPFSQCMCNDCHERACVLYCALCDRFAVLQAGARLGLPSEGLPARAVREPGVRRVRLGRRARQGLHLAVEPSSPSDRPALRPPACALSRTGGQGSSAWGVGRCSGVVECTVHNSTAPLTQHALDSSGARPLTPDIPHDLRNVLTGDLMYWRSTVRVVMSPLLGAARSGRQTTRFRARRCCAASLTAPADLLLYITFTLYIFLKYWGSARVSVRALHVAAMFRNIPTEYLIYQGLFPLVIAL